MHTAERISLARLPSGVDVETTVHVYEGNESGPTLYVQAAQHGREVNGTEVLRRLHGRIDHEALAGRLVAVPVADPLTFDRVSYTTPEVLDSVNANMNRCWPGDPEGTLHERMAARLWEFASDADALVDLHTGSPTMLTHTVFQEGDPGSAALAEAFGTELLLAEAAGDEADVEWSERGFDGKLRVTATRDGVPAITPELAHSKQLVEQAIETGVRGVFNVLRHLDMLQGAPDPHPEQRLGRNHLGRVVAEDSGLYRPSANAELGETVEEGDFLGRVYDPTSYEELQEVEAVRDGLVYSVAREATVTAGQTLVGVAMPYHDETWADEDAEADADEPVGDDGGA
ncbi:succinylglutamate desuccinylase/aspartoacylase family protein [Halobium salinum]|uniref:Succinylglutamate desuccinylase/aspartoacylase family protein n=1 Tax=Halobium salinum TaxID=1364940 RepID=A0ABD5PAU4_9EURY|nr:succinylglutamate desuccinylase/aspartoacylase family protein [Halobium salinum]